MGDELDDLDDLARRARRILDDNWDGDSTRPAPTLYPHQWNWDTGFIAIGRARDDTDRAMTEMSTLFDAQWANGMLPQIVFNPDALGGYFPEPEFWQGERSPHYPEDRLTSGITMPPIHATAALHVLKHAPDGDAVRRWLKDLYPRLVDLHEYLYRDRDPEGEGLVAIRHPWESGVDNSPVWDPPLRRIEVDPEAVPDYRRRDLDSGVPASERPSDDDYDRYVLLIDLFRRLDYDEAAMMEESPFLVQAPLFNAILARADEDLVEIGGLLGEDTGRIREWAQATSRALREKMWHAEHGAYDAFDLREGEPIGTLTAEGFMPLICSAPSAAEAERIYEVLDAKAFCPMHEDQCFSIPSYSISGDFFDADNYWRGPVWININWLLAVGLERHGFSEKARSVRHDIVELVRRCGFYEYYDPFEGAGYGTVDFSWTAALFLDVVAELNDGH